MCPKIWIFDTYSICMLLGVFFAFLVCYLFCKKYKLKRAYTYDLLILGCVAVIAGIISAWAFQALFDLFKNVTGRNAITFYGGLFGGALSFIIGYFVVVCKRYPEIKFYENVYTIAPACITIAHSIGRVGCFCAGCCYGIETESSLGIVFPGMTHAVYPTQLFEAIFLFVLFLVLFYFAYFKRFKYSMSIYLFSYGTWRFLIEFIRGDDRGAYLLGLSPSQWFSLLAVCIGIVMTIIVYKSEHKKEV